MSITDARARNAKPNDKDYKVADDRGLYPPKLRDRPYYTAAPDCLSYNRKLTGVIAMVCRRLEDSEEAYRSRHQCSQWELPVVELVLGSDNRDSY